MVTKTHLCGIDKSSRKTNLKVQGLHEIQTVHKNEVRMTLR